MKAIKIVQVFVLFCMFFNISHATLVALSESCEHQHDGATHHEINKSPNGEDESCEDLCDIHHLFHFSAILNNQNVTIDNFSKYTLTINKQMAYLPWVYETSIKPPIV